MRTRMVVRPQVSILVMVASFCTGGANFQPAPVTIEVRAPAAREED
jgi:hypothetical protein